MDDPLNEDSSEEASSEDPDSSDFGTQSDTTGSISHTSGQRAAEKPSKLQESRTQSSGGSLKAYKDLLNAVISDVVSNDQFDDGALWPSQIGASYWTTAEKIHFFNKLSVCGPDNLPALKAAVQTKSELEIRAYLLLLRAGVSEARTSLPSKAVLHLDGIPAACEVDASCEHALDVAATKLSRVVEKHDMKLGKEKYGERWLIDKRAAAEIEQLISSHASDDIIPHAHAISDGSADEQDSEPSTASARPGDVDSEAEDQSPFVKGVEPETPDTDWGRSVKLMRPIAFIRLSHALFMNNADSTRDSWSTLLSSYGALLPDLDGPAVYRTALEDFHNLAVSVTRRLVQASIFQALTRLRAKERTSQPVEAIREADVRTAAELVGLSTDRTRYWALLARRCGVQVYTDSLEFKDGRPGSKNGVLLSYGEVERKLGLQQSTQRNSEADLAGVSKSDIEAILEDSDLWTSGSGDSSSDRQTSQTGQSTDDSDLDSDTETTSKRKAPASVRNRDNRKRRKLDNARHEDAALEAFDQQRSEAEQHYLWDVLGHGTSVDLQQNLKVTNGQGFQRTEQVPAWREQMVYEAPWEHCSGILGKRPFEEMSARYESTSTRRALAYASVKHQRQNELDATTSPAGDESSSE